VTATPAPLFNINYIIDELRILLNGPSGMARAGKNLRFFKQVFRFLSFLGFLVFLEFLVLMFTHSRTRNIGHKNTIN